MPSGSSRCSMDRRRLSRFLFSSNARGEKVAARVFHERLGKKGRILKENPAENAPLVKKRVPTFTFTVAIIFQPRDSILRNERVVNASRMYTRPSIPPSLESCQSVALISFLFARGISTRVDNVRKCERKRERERESVCVSTLRTKIPAGTRDESFPVSYVAPKYFSRV